MQYNYTIRKIKITLIKNPIVIILLAIFFTITTCTTDNSITGNSNQSLGKTTGIVDISSPADGSGFIEEDPRYWSNFIYHNYGGYAGCFVAIINSLLDKSFLDGLETYNPQHSINSSYDFRDNYLSKSEKGEVYTACYYILSNYSIKNNLVNKYYKEHYELLKNSIEIAYDLQHGNNNNSILINKSTSDDLKDILKVYRNSPNHKDIESVLQYLEADLEKYYNKPKYEIAADFK